MSDPFGTGATGPLSADSPVRLYARAAGAGATGLLTFQLPDRKVWFHFRRGNLERVGTSLPADGLAQFLVRQGAATGAQLTQAQTNAGRFGNDLVQALFGLGILNPGSHFPLLSRHAVELLSGVLCVRSGNFVWEAKELPAQQALPLGDRWALLIEAVRRLPVGQVQAQLGERLHQPLQKSGGAQALQQLRLSPQELRALGNVDGVRSLAQLCTAVPAESDTLVRLTFFLRDLDLLTFAQSTVAAAPPPPSAASPTAAGPQLVDAVMHTVPQAGAGAAPTAPPPAAATPVATRTGPPPQAPATKPVQAVAPQRPATVAAAPTPPPRTPTPAPRTPTPPPRTPTPAPISIEAELALMRKCIAELPNTNALQLLEVDEKADSAAIKVQYFKLVKRHHPDLVPPEAPEELRKLKADYFAAIGDAFRKIGEDKARTEYLDELKSGAREVDLQSILAAEEAFGRGMRFAKARKFPEAVAALDSAISTNPDEGEYYAWRGYSKYFVIADKGKGLAEAKQDIALALEKNPMCAEAHYLSGQLLKLSGEAGAAARAFQKTVELNAQHVDAQRELRLIQKK